MDICMPGVLGTDAAAEMLEKNPEMGVIFLTTSDDYAIEAFAMNATHYLLKPFSQEEFDAAVDRTVKKQRRMIFFPLTAWTAHIGFVSVK